MILPYEYHDFPCVLVTDLPKICSFPSINDFRLSRSWMGAASEPGMERPPQNGPEERGDREKPRAKAAGNGHPGHRPQAKCHENFKGRLLASKARFFSGDMVSLRCLHGVRYDYICFFVIRDDLWVILWERKTDNDETLLKLKYWNQGWWWDKFKFGNDTTPTE